MAVHVLDFIYFFKKIQCLNKFSSCKRDPDPVKCDHKSL